MIPCYDNASLPFQLAPARILFRAARKNPIVAGTGSVLNAAKNASHSCHFLNGSIEPSSL